jgi:hypothetical protein
MEEEEDDFTIEQEMWGRDDIDKTVRKAGQEIYKAAMELGSELWGAITVAAKKHAISPEYLLHSLNRSTSRFPGKGGEAFKVAYLILTENPPLSLKFFNPSKEVADKVSVDLAMRDVIKWAEDDFIYAIAKITVDTAKKYAGVVQAARATQGSAISRSQGAHVILVELPLRTKDHPYWFRDSRLLYRMLDLFLDI